LVDYIVDLGLSNELVVIFIAALPILELRGAIPVAINILDINWTYALILAFIGNMLPVPFILLFIEKGSSWLRRYQIFDKFFSWLFQRTQHRGRIIERYKFFGLILFVAIPLPVTGAWTGSLAAVIFGISFKTALLAIATGVLIAGLIITTLSLLGWIGAAIAGIGLIFVVSLGLWQKS
jgi:uncharacterized membrane protein